MCVHNIPLIKQKLQHHNISAVVHKQPETTHLDDNNISNRQKDDATRIFVH
jgi:hypothetical protein